MIYFKFIDSSCNTQQGEGRKKGMMQALSSILSFVLPHSNPDFEKRYDQVHTWYIEYDEEKNLTNREVGTNENGDVIVKGPYRKNLGFWTNEDLTLEQYQQHFDITTISHEQFTELWKEDIWEK